MAWGKQKNRKPEEAKVEQTELPQEPEQERTQEMGEELSGLKVTMEAAERFLDHAKTVKAILANGATPEQIKKSPDMRRLKRASLDLSSELVIMRKELP